MRISDAYERLDRRLTIAIRQRDEGIFKITSRLKGRIPAYIFEDQNVMYVQLFFSKANPPEGNLSPILARSDLVEKTTSYSIIEKMHDKNSIEAIHRILDTSAVVIDGTYVSENELFMILRFHSSVRLEINEIIREYVGRSEFFRLVSLGNARNLKSRMMMTNEYMPISVIRFYLEGPIESEVIEHMRKRHMSFVAETEGRQVTDKGVRALIYTENAMEMPGARIISKDRKTNEAYIGETSALEARRRGFDVRVPRVAYFTTLEGDRLVDTAFVPASEAWEYVSLLLSLDEKGNDPKPVLEHYSMLNDDVWEWL